MSALENPVHPEYVLKSQPGLACERTCTGRGAGNWIRQKNAISSYFHIVPLHPKVQYRKNIRTSFSGPIFLFSNYGDLHHIYRRTVLKVEQGAPIFLHCNGHSGRLRWFRPRFRSTHISCHHTGENLGSVPYYACSVITPWNGYNWWDLYSWISVLIICSQPYARVLTRSLKMTL